MTNVNNKKIDYGHLRRLDQQPRDEIDKVTTDASLSTRASLPLKAQKPLNPRIFAPTGLRLFFNQLG
jgi:hypothetical protein